MYSCNRFIASLVAVVAVLSPVAAMADQSGKFVPLTIEEQGSVAVGGTVLTTPGTYDNNNPTAVGQTFHGDHLYAFYQVPQNPKALPIVMLHGAYQSARSWETTPGACRQQHRGDDSRANAVRPTVLRSVPARKMAGLFR